MQAEPGTVRTVVATSTPIELGADSVLVVTFERLRRRAEDIALAACRTFWVWV
jgi:hypothetical protein